MSRPVVPVSPGSSVVLLVGTSVALAVAVPVSESVSPVVVVVGSVEAPVLSVTVVVAALPVAESSRTPLSPHAVIHNTPSENLFHRMRPT
jgi:hypothetical protein